MGLEPTVQLGRYRVLKHLHGVIRRLLQVMKGNVPFRESYSKTDFGLMTANEQAYQELMRQIPILNEMFRREIPIECKDKTLWVVRSRIEMFLSKGVRTSLGPIGPLSGRLKGRARRKTN